MEKLKIGVLGVSGHFLKRIVLPLLESEKVELYGIASRNIEKAKETAEKYNIEKYYGSYDELLADQNIQAVYIPLPNHMHKEWIIKSIDAKKHVLCEKPIAMNVNETIEIMDYVSYSDYQLMEAFMFRFHPKWLKAKEMIKLGYIGKINYIHTVFSYNNQDPANIRNIKDYGGGALMDIGCYAINSSRYIMGRIPNRVISLMSNHELFNTDSLTSAMMDFGDARALFTTSTSSYPQQEVKIFGSEGSLTVTIPFNDISDINGKLLFENGETKESVKTKATNQYKLMFDQFAYAINNGYDEPLSLEDSLENMKVIDAILESSETNGWVTID